jgi:hypothetical protein
LSYLGGLRPSSRRGVLPERRGLGKMRSVPPWGVPARRGLARCVLFPNRIASRHRQRVCRGSWHIGKDRCRTFARPVDSALCSREMLKDHRLGAVELGDHVTDGGAVERIANKDEIQELDEWREVAHLVLFLLGEQLLSQRGNTDEEAHPIVVVKEKLASDQFV